MIYHFDPTNRYEVLCALDYYTRSQKGEAKLAITYSGRHKAHFAIDSNPFGRKAFVDHIATISKIDLGSKKELTANHAHRLVAISLEVSDRQEIQRHALAMAIAYRKVETHQGCGNVVFDYVEKVLSLEHQNRTLSLADKMTLVNSQRIAKYRLEGKDLVLIASAFGTVAAVAPLPLLEMLERLNHKPTQ